MKFERMLDGKAVYSETINGRVVRATTTGGELGARRIFEIMRRTNGVATSPAQRMDDTELTFHR